MSSNKALDLLREFYRQRSLGHIGLLTTPEADQWIRDVREHLAETAPTTTCAGEENPRPWRTLDPRDAPEEPDGWVVLDAEGREVALISFGNYESDKAAAELIVRAVNGL